MINQFLAISFFSNTKNNIQELTSWVFFLNGYCFYISSAYKKGINADLESHKPLQRQTKHIWMSGKTYFNKYRSKKSMPKLYACIQVSPEGMNMFAGLVF